MFLTRSSGILLHPTSLPCTPGIGTIGKQAFRFIDWLKEANQSIWQILPIGPTGYGDSPYASFSTFAGNPLLIDLDILCSQSFLTQEEITPPEWISFKGNIDFGSVVYWKTPLLKKAAACFADKLAQDEKLKSEYDEFAAKQNFWLENYATFMSIKEFYDAQAQKENKFGAMWSNYWPVELATCNKKAVSKWQKTHKAEIEAQKAIQFFFFSQWTALKKYANDNNISIIGDIPIFVAPDSADVWANQKLFQLDENGKATAVAGVPPDYFCATGQLWGNPLYNWAEMKKTNYAWWIQRIKSMMSIVDYVRIDHFRGFEAYWSVPAGEETAVNGKWIKGPAHDLFNAIKAQLGDIPIIAEDLGVITDEVRALRDDFELPGMKVLQFAFDLEEEKRGGLVNSFLPHMYTQNCVVYTGTHDNDTLTTWLSELSPEMKELVKKYTGVSDDNKLCDELIRLALASTAAFAVVPLQDLYKVGKEGRMNAPATTGTNWQWRMSEDFFAEDKALWLKEQACLYGRNLKK
ncbi:MAG: 4-alpha-glucanotransferase [Treponemataceae bacterium]|nr:4-alpha-glucanotransferase [Treponemataceae bacterium]